MGNTVAYGLAVSASLNSAFRERVSRIAPTSAGFRGELCPLSGQMFSGRPAGASFYATSGVQLVTDIDQAWFVKMHQGSGVASGTG